MNQEIVTKKCTKCQEIKPVSEFNKNHAYSDGYVYRCKKCTKIYRKELYDKNPQKYRLESKKQRLKNPQYLKEYNKKYQHTYYLTHKNTTIKDYQNKTKHHRKLCNRKYRNKKRTTDIHYRLRCNISARQREALKNNAKFGCAIKLLMCSIAEWKKYIESLWSVGMSWDNYGNKEGQWSIDHIIPCAFFDLTNPVEQYMCFRWQNTRPMWQIDNAQKGDNIILEDVKTFI